MWASWCAIIIIIIIIISSFYSLWSVGLPWRPSKRCDLQLSPWLHSLIFLYFLFPPLVLRHVLFGLHLLLYPWGFQSSAVFSIAPASLLNPFNVKINPICHLLALLEAHHILHVSRIRVNVCLILFHFLLFIRISIGFCLVILHGSFVILSKLI
jgi:hypothetical protein